MRKILLLALLALLAGCAAKPKDMKHGILVDDWYVWPDRSVAYFDIDGVTHHCKYKDGTIIVVGVSRTKGTCP